MITAVLAGAGQRGGQTYAEYALQHPGEIKIIAVAEPNEERRKELVKQSKGVGETAKVSIRNARRDAIDEFKKMVKSGLPEDEAKDAEDEVQKITDSYNKKIDEILTAKEKDIMTI